MKTLDVTIMSVVIVIGFVAFDHLYDAEPEQVASDHLAMAKGEGRC